MTETPNMSSLTHHVPALLVCFIFLFSHCLLSTQARKYYPDEPPIKTIVLDNGDVVDCVDFYSQPAMKYPLVRRNPQFKAKFPLQGAITEQNKSHGSMNDDLEGIGLRRGSCPLGSVPFLKATKAGPLNLTAINDFKRSGANFLRSKTIKPEVNLEKDHEYATMKVDDGEYTGAQGTINIWQPTIEDFFEISVSQLWVARRYDDDENFATLEAGWAVHRALFGDYKTRFFILTTNNSYETRLYNDNIKHPRSNNNLQFVRYSSNYLAIGSQLSTSVNEGEQKVFQIKIQKNDYENWDLSVDGHLIGYWPHENYDDGFPLANELQWGGEIVNKESRGRHTSTQMGSGHFSEEGIGKAAFISNIGLFDEENKYYDAPEEPDGIITHPGCYDLTYWEADAEYGRYITMGGPGYDEDRCP